ncbi:AMP-binding protein [Asanoa sp. NPDC050611]|uniref:class I adenylate-forming enzyme family protein n=1 Tax=Asanoa sp. NPDC050611 TaxID=3157098 RepID=UPI0033F9A360
MPEAETQALPLDALPRRAAVTAPGRAAIRFGAHALSYRDLDAAVDGFAAALAGRRPGTVVGVTAALHPAFPVAYFGTVRAGHTCAVVDPGADLDALIERAGIELLVATAGMADRLRRIRVERDLDVLYLDQPGEHGGRTVAALARTPARRRKATIDLDAVACLRFDAQGRPIPLSHRNLTVGAAQAAQAYGFEPGSTVVNHLPTYEQVYLNAAVHAAATQVLCADPDPAGGVTLAGREEATHYCGLPAPLAKLAADPRDTHPRTTTVRAVLASGATLPPAAALRLATRVGAPLVQWYGPAGGPLTHCDRLDGPTAGSVGRPVPGTDCHVLAPPGKPGQVKVRGPQVATAMTDPDGWLRTGDVGYLDEAGALFLTQGVTA